MQECQTNACQMQKNCQSGECAQPSGQCPPSSCPQSAGQSKSCSTGCEMTDELMEIADSAWGCLMKEKMKAHFEKVSGKHMDSVAAAAVEASLAHWNGVMKLKAGKRQMKNDMAEAVHKVQQAMGKE